MPTVHPIDLNNPDLQILVDQNNTVVFFHEKAKSGNKNKIPHEQGTGSAGTQQFNNFLVLLSLYRVSCYKH
jgi:hypothetical protein